MINTLTYNPLGYAWQSVGLHLFSEPIQFYLSLIFYLRTMAYKNIDHWLLGI